MSWKKPLLAGVVIAGSVILAELGAAGPLPGYGYDQTCGVGVCGGGSHLSPLATECRYAPGDPSRNFILVQAPDFLTVNGGMASQYATWRPIIYHWDGFAWQPTVLPFETPQLIGYLEFPEGFATPRNVPITVGGYYALQ